MQPRRAAQIAECSDCVPWETQGPSLTAMGLCCSPISGPQGTSGSAASHRELRVARINAAPVNQVGRVFAQVDRWALQPPSWRAVVLTPRTLPFAVGCPQASQVRGPVLLIRDPSKPLRFAEIHSNLQSTRAPSQVTHHVTVSHCCQVISSLSVELGKISSRAGTRPQDLL